jgi:hypothetical protein
MSVLNSPNKISQNCGRIIDRDVSQRWQTIKMYMIGIKKNYCGEILFVAVALLK